MHATKLTFLSLDLSSAENLFDKGHFFSVTFFSLNQIAKHIYFHQLILHRMKISFAKYFLELKHQFTISFSSRKFTPVVLVRLEQNGLFGYGEASLPPYLSEDQESVISFISKAKLNDMSSYDDLVFNLESLDQIKYDNTAAKASIDIALHDLLGKIQNKSCCEFYNLNPVQLPLTSFTIGIDSEEMIKQKIREAQESKILKVKIGTENDKEIINIIRHETDKPLYVDANQGWNKKEHAIEMIEWLNEKNVLLVEQPMPKINLRDHKWLKERSPIPIIADEAFRRLSDLDDVSESYSGINIKLMKCTGIREADKIITKAKEKGLKIMLGCMTETSCAISAAIQFSSLVDFADLDGNQLITNDPFKTKTVEDGRLVLQLRPGIGVDLINNIDFVQL